MILGGPWFCNCYSEEEFWLSILNSDVLTVHGAGVVQSCPSSVLQNVWTVHCARVVQSCPSTVFQNVWTVHCARVVQTSPPSASGFLYAPWSPLSSLCLTQIFYTNFIGITSVIQLMNNWVASGIRCLQNVGT